MKRSTSLVISSLFAALASCSAAQNDDAVPVTVGGAGGGSGAAGAPPVVNPLGRARCQAPAGVSASPQNTQEAVTLLNALPKPTSVACFVESLARPLLIQATDSIFSAQPALSATSPRVFIKVGQGWISVVVDGDGSYLLEFGDAVPEDPNRSIKGELVLPIREPVAPSAPYDRVMFSESSTTCGLCHYDERRADTLPYPNAFASTAFQPRPDSLVSVESLRGEHQRCDWQTESHRCEMLSALFDGGDVIQTPFTSTMATFF